MAGCPAFTSRAAHSWRMPAEPADFESLSRQINEMAPREAAIRARQIAGSAREAGQEGYALFFEGEAFCLEGEYSYGEKLEREAVRRLPEIPFILANFGVLLSLQGRVREALHYLNRALSLRSDDLLALAQKGVCLAKLNRDEEAVLCFDQVLSLEPDNLHALRNKGVSLSRLGLEMEGLNYLKRVLEINPLDAHARSEKKILEDELVLKSTPLGKLLLWIRKKVTPAVKRLFYRLLDSRP